MKINITSRDRVKLYMLEWFSGFVFSYILSQIVLIITMFITNDLSETAMYAMGFYMKLVELLVGFSKDFYHKCGSRGMKMLGYKIIDAKTGEKPCAMKLILRHLLELDGLTTTIGLFVCWKRSDRLTIHDLITKTRIVYDDDDDSYDDLRA